MTFFGDGEAGDLVSSLQSLQAELESAQAAAHERTVEGVAGGGVVRIRATGDLSFAGVVIDPSVVDPAEVSLIEDLVLAALRDLATKLEELRRDAMGSAVNNALTGLFGSLTAFDDDDDDDDEEEDDDDEDDDAVDVHEIEPVRDDAGDDLTGGADRR